MSDLKVRLLVARVINGGVWPKGEVVLISQRTAEQWIAAGQAEEVSEQRSTGRRRKAEEDEEPNESE